MRQHWPRSRAAAVAAAVIGALAACGPNTVAPSEGTIASIAITPDSSSLATGGVEDLSAGARTAAGSAVPGQQFYWSTSDSLIATVSQSGVVQAHQPGAVQIGASAQGLSGLARVIVVAPVVKSVRITPAVDSIYASHPADTAVLSGSAYDSAGHPITGSLLFWSTNSALVSVTAGVVIGTNTGTGTATITATSPDSGLPSATATVKVIGHVASVTVSPAFAYLSTSGSFLLSQQMQFTAALADTFGNDVTGQRTLSWSSSDRTVATVDKHGLVTAVSTSGGTAQITAVTPDGASGSATVTVFP